MSVLGLQVLKNTSLQEIEKAFGRPEVKEYGVDYLELDNKRYAQFFVHHSDMTPITKEENIKLQRWLQNITKLPNITRLNKLQEVINV
tara:strand:- start:130 stop:393 length:264 start_codon:yes stop_codon:yes gene_type:complete